MSPNPAEKMTNVAKQNVDAVGKSGDAAVAGLGTIGKSYQEMVTRTIEHVTASIKALSSVKTPEEFFEVQQRQIKEGFELAFANSRTMFGLTSSAYGNAVAPLQKQAKEIQNDLKSAA